jgi:hypothetical protein
MIYRGSCHCGQVAFEVEGGLKKVSDCNCSMCSRMGSLHWFVPRDTLRLLTPASNLKSYFFGQKTINHLFCANCGIHAFGEGSDPAGNKMAAVNARCLEGVDVSALPVGHFDGKSL